jgi:hypothetical protein
MRPEQDLVKALRALADADRDLEASPEVEAKLREAFRRRHAHGSTRFAWIAVWAAAAAAVVVFVVMQDRPRNLKMAHPGVEPTVISPPVVAAAVSPATTPVQRASRVHRVRQREIVTDFFPLIEGMPPMERGELVRVSLPAAAMQTVGLPVREDRLAERIQADVLVNEEGLATAIRFVSRNP